MLKIPLCACGDGEISLQKYSQRKVDGFIFKCSACKVLSSIRGINAFFNKFPKISIVELLEINLKYFVLEFSAKSCSKQLKNSKISLKTVTKVYKKSEN